MGRARSRASAPPAPVLRAWRDHLSERLLLLLVGALCLLGLLALYSIGRAHHAHSTEYLAKQAAWMGLAALAMWVTTRLRFDKLRGIAWVAGLGAIALLVLVLIPGVGLKINGARRWLDLGPMNMQVSDFAKLGGLFYFAHYLSSRQRELGSFWRGFVFPCAMIGVVGVLLLLQPDFGTAALFAAVGVTLLFLAGCRLFYLVPAALGAVALFGLLVLQDPIRLRRITSFLDLAANREGGGYQLWQGLLSFASGGSFGVGLGNSRQPLSFLPEAHTDFIFAVIGEELGLAFTGLTVVVFAVFFLLVIWELRRAPQMFDFLLVSGALLFISMQALINLGVVTGLLPTKGMSLPFISYGGSNLVVMGVFVGIILNLVREWNAGVRTPPGEIRG
jgi:cell division protein FtsW